MTTKPIAFEATKGPPTREQARTVFHSMADQRTRSVAEKMRNMGWEISDRSMARWIAKDFAEPKPKGSKTMAEKGKVKGVAKVLKQEMAKIPAETVAEADKLVQEGGLVKAVADPNVADMVRINARILGLMAVESDSDLERSQGRARAIMNIVLMEEVTRRAHVMTLIPRDTAALVTATSESSEVKLVGAGMPAPGDPKLIEGRVVPDNPLSEAIDDFLKEHELA